MDNKKRIQVTLPMDLYLFLEEIQKKYNISKSNQIALLVGKYGGKEFVEINDDDN